MPNKIKYGIRCDGRFKYMKNIEQYLSKFGITETEIQLYLKLLKLNTSTITELSSKTRIPRTTVHTNVERLIQRGLVTQSIKKERRKLFAENPEKIKILLVNRQIQLENDLRSVKNLGKELPEFIKIIQKTIPSSEKHSKISVKYYEGKQGAKLIYQEAFSAKELRSYVNLEATHEVFSDNTKLFNIIQKRNPSLIIKEIIPHSEKSIKKAKQFARKSNFQFRVTSLPINLTSIDILIYDGKVAMINFRGNTIVGSVLENNDYYYNSKIIFDFLWNNLKKL